MSLSARRPILALSLRPSFPLFALLALSLLHLPNAAALPKPSGNGTDLHHVGFVSDPTGRGTFSLVTSCFLTLFTCVWTALHFNARPAQSVYTITFERVLWMIPAVVAPETVLFCAHEQWMAARDLRGAVNLIGGRASANAQLVHTNSFGAVQDPCGSYESKKSTLAAQNIYLGEQDTDQHVPIGPKHTFSTWGRSQAFYAATGGFAVDSSSFADIDKVVFTPAGILELARAGILPDVTEDEIRGMSRQDGIAKIGVCVQVAWFLLQSLSRVSVGLPLTLLELHVIAHVLCTFVMYGLWFHKPYTGSAPYICKDRRIIDMAALFCLEELPLGTQQKNRRQTQGLKRVSCALEETPNRFGPLSPAASIGRCSPPLLDPPADDGLYSRWISALLRRPVGGSSVTDPALTKARHQERLLAAQRAARYLGKHGSHFTWYQDENTGKITFPMAYVVKSMPDTNVHGLLYSQSANEHATMTEKTRLYAWCGFYMVYGSIFLVAWNFEFPTIIEMWLWRASSVALVFYGILVSLTLGIQTPFISTTLGAKARATYLKAEKKSALFNVVKFFLFFVMGFTWASARWYITIESLISLRRVPVGTYETVNWTNHIPHIN